MATRSLGRWQLKTVLTFLRKKAVNERRVMRKQTAMLGGDFSAA